MVRHIRTLVQYSPRDGITSSSSILFWEESRVVKPDFAFRPCPSIWADLQFFLFFLPSWKSLCVRHANAMPPSLLSFSRRATRLSWPSYYTTTNIKMRKRILSPDPTYSTYARHRLRSHFNMLEFGVGGLSDLPLAFSAQVTF